MEIKFFFVPLHQVKHKNQITMATNFYTQNGWQGDKYDGNSTTKEIAAAIRQDIKGDKDLNVCKWSVSFHLASMCAEIFVYLLEAPKEVRQNPEQDKYFSNIGSGDDSRLNDYGKKIMKKVRGIVDSYNYSDCDGMIDYFNVRFYDTIGVGKWDREFIVKSVKVSEMAGKAAKNGNLPPVSGAGLTLNPYGERAIVVRGETKPIKDTLKSLGGAFNPRLNGGAGWIFSKRNEEKVRAALGL